jgi:hypothetical protein
MKVSSASPEICIATATVSWAYQQAFLVTTYQSIGHYARSTVAVLESLLCSETLSPDSPTGSFLEERRSRILLMDYDETLYGERALVQKLLDQKISLDVSCWGKNHQDSS